MLQKDLFPFLSFFLREKTFSYSLRLLESEAIIHGKYSLPDHDSFEGSAQATVTLPTGQVFSTNLNLTHTYDGIIRNIVVSLNLSCHEFSVSKFHSFYILDSKGCQPAT